MLGESAIDTPSLHLEPGSPAWYGWRQWFVTHLGKVANILPPRHRLCPRDQKGLPSYPWPLRRSPYSVNEIINIHQIGEALTAIDQGELLLFEALEVTEEPEGRPWTIDEGRT